MVQVILKKNDRGKEEIVDEKIFIENKEVKMRFTQPMWYRLEDEICTLDELYTMMHSKGRFGRNKIPALVAIMTDGQISADEFLSKTDPGTTAAVIRQIEKTIADALRMKEKKYDDDSVHDEVLEEIEKKEAKAD